MEDTLREKFLYISKKLKEVLILVLMEDTLRVRYKHQILLMHRIVLILVLMEDTLRAFKLLNYEEFSILS